MTHTIYYIVDTYNKYERNDDVVYRFEYNKREWCIRKVDSFEWGKPQFDELPLDSEFIEYKIYATSNPDYCYYSLFRIWRRWERSFNYYDAHFLIYNLQDGQPFEKAI